MSYGNYEFESFSTKEGFNKSLGHFQAVSGLLGELEDRANLADLLSDLLENKEIEQKQMAPTVKALLVDKYTYLYDSLNIPETISDFKALCDEVKGWNSLDIVLAYLHPELGYTLINPKNMDHWGQVRELKRNELVTVYAGAAGDKKKTDDMASSAISLILKMLAGKTVSPPEALKKGAYKVAVPVKKVVKKASPVKKAKAVKTVKDVAAPQVVVQKEVPVQREVEETPSANKRMTPFYSVPVTNELFHNGNVEAWKKIIQSFTTKHPGLEVYIFYDGEKINDIHSLFKWGKVKHGSTILFAVAGENIQDVAKLQRYLRQGASPRFEDFLRFPVNTILKLF